MFFIIFLLIIITVIVLIKFIPVSIKTHIYKNKKKYIIGIALMSIFLLWFIIVEQGTFDHSAELENYGTDGMIIHWNNSSYSHPFIGFTYSKIGKVIATSSNKKVLIREIEDDKSHTFIAVGCEFESGPVVYKKDDYEIPKGGKISAIYWDCNRIKDDNFIKAVSFSINNPQDTFEYTIEGEFISTLHGDSQYMKRLSFCYGDCPVGTDSKGYMGKINGKFVIANEVYSNNKYGIDSIRKYSCKVIPDKYIMIMEKYFKKLYFSAYYK